MINATLKLTRSADDGAVMYRKYFLVADFGTVRGQGNASIIPMSAGAPMPASDQFSVRGGETEAINGPLLFEWARKIYVPGHPLPAGTPDKEIVSRILREKLN